MFKLNKKLLKAVEIVCSNEIRGRCGINILSLRTSGYDSKIGTLQKILDCDYRSANLICKKYKQLSLVDTENLEKTAELLVKFGIQRDDLYDHPLVLTIPHATVQNRFMVLQEGGFKKIGANIILSYLTVVRRRVSLLKAYGLIPDETDIAEAFLSHTEPVPQYVEPYVCPVSCDDATFSDIHISVMRYYISWRLGIQYDELNKIMTTYNRFKFKSLRLMVRTINILLNDLGFSSDKIASHAYLIYSNPDNTLEILNSVKSIGGEDTRTFLRKCPKIIMTNSNTLMEILQHLQSYGISDVAIRNCPHVFTLGSETVRWRLEQLQQVPQFQPLLKHPRVLRLVHYQTKAQIRLDHLQEAQVRCASLHLLCSSKEHFQRYLNEGTDKTKGTDIVYFLSSILEVNELEVRQKLQLHPFYCYVPLTSIKDVLEFLQESGYTKKQINETIHLVLYPRDIVEEELNRLPEREELSPQRLCVDSMNVSISKDHHLPLCLYFIEKKHHFTGNGIWPKQTGPQKTMVSKKVEEIVNT